MNHFEKHLSFRASSVSQIYLDPGGSPWMPACCFPSWHFPSGFGEDPVLPQKSAVRKGRQTGGWRVCFWCLPLCHCICPVPFPLLALSYLLLTKQHQPSFKQGEAPDVPNRHVRSGRLRDLCNRWIWGYFQLRLWLWEEEGMLVSEPPLSPSDALLHVQNHARLGVV